MLGLRTKEGLPEKVNIMVIIRELFFLPKQILRVSSFKSI